MAFFNELFISGDIAPDYETENVVLFNEDCLNVLKTMKNNSVDLIVTDPPYRITNGGGGITKERKEILWWYSRSFRWHKYQKRKEWQAI